MLEVYTLPESENEFFRVRKEKLQRIRGKGINPYPTKFHRTHTSKQAVDEFIKSETSETLIDNQISVAGRIMGRRGMGKASFIDLRDIDGNIQIMMRANQLNERYEDLEDLDPPVLAPNPCWSELSCQDKILLEETMKLISEAESDEERAQIYKNTLDWISENGHPETSQRINRFLHAKSIENDFTL